MIRGGKWGPLDCVIRVSVPRSLQDHWVCWDPPERPGGRLILTTDRELAAVFSPRTAFQIEVMARQAGWDALAWRADEVKRKVFAVNRA